MRVIFYTFLSILGLILSVIILMPALFDVNNYKGKIENLFYNKTNNTLKIAGDISLSFLSGLRLSVKDISFVSNDGDNLFKSEELLLFLVLCCPLEIDQIGVIDLSCQKK